MLLMQRNQLLLLLVLVPIYLPHGIVICLVILVAVRGTSGVIVPRPGRIRMHYVTQRSHWIQKHKFSVTCPRTLFVETASGPPEHEKLCVDVSCPGRTRVHYVSHRSHWMQKHKFSVTCLGALFVETTQGPPKQENSASMFRTPDA
jgi:hypothetical protein